MVADQLRSDLQKDLQQLASSAQTVAAARQLLPTQSYGPLISNMPFGANISSGRTLLVTPQQLHAANRLATARHLNKESFLTHPAALLFPGMLSASAGPSSRPPSSRSTAAAAAGTSPSTNSRTPSSRQPSSSTAAAAAAGTIPSTNSRTPAASESKPHAAPAVPPAHLPSRKHLPPAAAAALAAAAAAVGSSADGRGTGPEELEEGEPHYAESDSDGDDDSDDGGLLDFLSSAVGMSWAADIVTEWDDARKVLEENLDLGAFFRERFHELQATARALDATLSLSSEAPGGGAAKGSGGLLPVHWWADKQAAAPSTPLTVKLLSWMLPDSLVDAVKAEVPDGSGLPLPYLVEKFLSRRFRAWARSNYKRLFLLVGVGVSLSCTIVHGSKELIKLAVRQVPPRLEPLRLRQAVGFTTDVLLPTPFFGPYLTVYLLLGVVLREGSGAKPVAVHAGSVAAPGRAGSAELRQLQQQGLGELQPELDQTQQQQGQQQQEQQTKAGVHQGGEP